MDKRQMTLEQRMETEKQRLLLPWFLALLTLQFKMLLLEANLQYYGILKCNKVGQPR